jgi:hypothetical protein
MNKKLGFLAMLVMVLVFGMIVVGCSGEESQLLGKWDLVEGPKRGNPENMDIKRGGKGLSDDETMTWKIENGRFYLTPKEDSYNVPSWKYEVSGSTLTLTADNGTVLKFTKK